MLEIAFRNLDNVKINKQDHFIAVLLAHLSISFNAAVFYCGENQPGRGIAEGEDPTGEDDATCSGQCADVLKTGSKVNFSKNCLLSILIFRCHAVLLLSINIKIVKVAKISHKIRTCHS